MKEKQALEEQKKLLLSDIALSLESYYLGREKNTTTRYFQYKNIKYPIMNIIKEALIVANKKRNEAVQINPKGYDNIQACIKTLEKNLCNITLL